MGKNVGNTDRVVRLVLAVLAVFGALQTDGALSIVLWLVAAIMAVTSVVGFCPLYRLFGMSTWPVDQR